jgi:hypothetical protein
MIGLFLATLFVIAAGTAALYFVLKLRATKAAEASDSLMLIADRYRPMLRLLRDDDLGFVAHDPRLRKTLRTRRRELFRAYLRCLTKDYARLLAGIRSTLVQSGTDRPDLVRALARNRLLFAFATCKIELRLMMHATGIGTVDISHLIDAVEVLRSQVRVLTTASVTV